MTLYIYDAAGNKVAATSEQQAAARTDLGAASAADLAATSATATAAQAAATSASAAATAAQTAAANAASTASAAQSTATSAAAAASAAQSTAAAAYAKPVDGIPRNDLANQVKDQLSLAETALQPGALPAGTTIPLSQVTGAGTAAATAASDYAAASHVHTVANVAGLQAALDGKMLDTLAAMSAAFVAGSAAEAAVFQSLVSGGGIALSRLSAAYRQARSSNPRALSPITLAVAAFGATPAAGTVGYATTGIATTGWTVYDYQIVNSPTPSIYPFRMRMAQHEYTSYGLRNIAYKTAAGTRVAGTGVWSVITNAPEVVIGVVSAGSAQPYSIVVDGRRCSTDISTGAGGILQAAINFRGLPDLWHTLDVLLSQDDRVAYLRVPSGYQVVTPPARPVIAMFTDSLGVTVTGGRAHDSYVAVAADYLGCDIRLFPYGGTGYENAGSGGEIFSARVQLAVPYMPAAPIAVILSGGANDPGTAGFEAAVANAVGAAKTQWPTAQTVCLGSFGPMTMAGYTAKLALEPRIKTAAQSAGALFVPTLTDPDGAWLRGTGTIESPTGSGVGDRYMSTADATLTHWVKAGHADVGLMLADGLAAVLGL